MKKISVIVPVYNVESQLNRCLESLINQTLDEIEIIIVNDGSTDGSQRIIDNFKEKYPEKIKSYIIKNSGAAKARNYALEQATGKYVGFVDGDDYVELNMFEELYNKAITEEADISVCGYYRTTQTKCIERGTYPYKCFDNNVFDEPSLFLNNLPYIWNKLFKRKLIEDGKIRFESLRIFEDLLFTYKLMLRANKITLVEKPLYYYRIYREESLTAVFSEKRFDIFKACDNLIDFFKENNAFEYFEDEILFIVLKHIFVVLEKEVSIKEYALKNKFINQAFRYLDTRFPFWKEYNYYYKKYKKRKTKYASKLWWKTFFIISKKKRKKIKRIIKLLKKVIKLLKTKSLGSKFKKYLNKPIENQSILIDSQHGSNINGNMFYILKELCTNKKYEKNKIYVAYKKKNKNNYTMLFENYKMKNIILIDVNSKKFTKVLATAKYVFNDTSFPAYYIKRNEQIYLNTWHGTPLKTLGKSTTNDFHDIANLQKNFVVADYLLYPNEYTMEHMKEDYMLNNISNNKIVLCGYPRNEIFFEKNRRKELKKILQLDNMEVIAYMPTWRGNVRKIQGKEQLKEIKGYLKYIDEQLNENQIMFVNFHPFVKDKIDFNDYEKIFSFPSQYETYDFLNISDMLITDYSSVLFDYAITKNKIILFTYDEEEYLRDRGLYLDLKQLPFKKVTTVENLMLEINKTNSIEFKEFINQFCKYERKNNSKLICDFIINNENTKMKIIDNHITQENIFLYAGSLNKNDKTDKLIEIINKTEYNKNYNYYISYVTEKIKNNKERLKLISNKIDYMGQLRSFCNISKFEKVMLFLLNRYKKMYNLFTKKYDNIFKTELKRIYNNIQIKAIIVYGKIGIRKICTFSQLDCIRILYIEDLKDFNKKVNKEIYKKYNYILVNNDETYEEIEKYCGTSKNILKIEKINSLNELEKFFNKKENEK